MGGAGWEGRSSRIMQWRVERAVGPEVPAMIFLVKAGACQCVQAVRACSVAVQAWSKSSGFMLQSGVLGRRRCRVKAWAAAKKVSRVQPPSRLRPGPMQVRHGDAGVATSGSGCGL